MFTSDLKSHTIHINSFFFCMWCFLEILNFLSWSELDENEPFEFFFFFHGRSALLLNDLDPKEINEGEVQSPGILVEVGSRSRGTCIGYRHVDACLVNHSSHINILTPQDQSIPRK